MLFSFKLDEIPNIIKNVSNAYEKKRGISTLEVILKEKYDRLAYFYGYKSDNTITVFVAFQLLEGVEGGWIWFCPNERDANGLKEFNEIYDKINKENELNREIKRSFLGS